MSLSLSLCLSPRTVGRNVSVCVLGHGAAVSPLQVPNWIMTLTSIRPSSVWNPPPHGTPRLVFVFEITILYGTLILFVYISGSVSTKILWVRMSHAKDLTATVVINWQSDNEWNRRNAVMSCQWRRSFFLLFFFASLCSLVMFWFAYYTVIFIDSFGLSWGLQWDICMLIGILSDMNDLQIC